MANRSKFTIYKLVSILAFVALVFILVLPQVVDVKKKENMELRYQQMKKIRSAVKKYMNTREQSFKGDLIELVRTGFLKHSYESPFNGNGDKYIAEGDYESGEVTVRDPNQDEVPITDEYKLKK